MNRGSDTFDYNIENNPDAKISFAIFCQDTTVTHQKFANSIV